MSASSAPTPAPAQAPAPAPAPLPARRAAGWHRFAQPGRFLRLTERATPVLWALAALVLAIGVPWALVFSPPDWQQGETVRIMYVHVPMAWLAMSGYATLALASLSGLVWRHPLADIVAREISPVGAAVTGLCLLTGSLWGKPMWGTWWVWDARLTSELILLFLYIGYMALTAAIDDPRRADKAGGLLLLVGVVNIPIIYFSVKWWNTLHQGSSVNLTKSSMATTMLYGMLLMALCFWMYAIAVALMRVRTIMLERERNTDWVKAELAGDGQ